MIGDAQPLPVKQNRIERPLQTTRQFVVRHRAE